jgi:hypothetical protein
MTGERRSGLRRQKLLSSSDRGVGVPVAQSGGRDPSARDDPEAIVAV